MDGHTPALPQALDPPDSEGDRPPRPRLPWLLLLLIAAAGTAAVAMGIRGGSEAAEAPPNEVAVVETPQADVLSVLTDSDGDGLPDAIERSGWRTPSGIYRTDPSNADTDGDGLSDGDEAGPFETHTGSESLYVGTSDPTSVDSDDDGLDDNAEVLGWTTQRGAVYRTQPMNPDTDGDGLTDADEAGAVQTTSGQEDIYAGVSDPTKADSDSDGLDDKAELRGWATQRGTVYRTQPMDADTDADGLTDGDEAGALIEGDRSEDFIGLSSPLLADTDGDGLNDAGEADLGLDAFDRDSDDDGLEDGREVQLIGTDPMLSDTDGDGLLDGYEDANRQTQGLDPLWFDEKVDAWDYASDFAKGAFAGDLWRGDSTAWLVGNLASGGASFIPGVGWVVGTVADVRDAVGSAIHADWVGAGFSAVGLVPEIGDALAVPAKIGRFVTRHPELTEVVASTVVALDKVPDHVKVQASKQMWSGWDDLVGAGTTESALLRLQQGKTNLDTLGAAMKRPTHVPGPSTPFFGNGYEAEEWLESEYKAHISGVSRQVRATTVGCLEVCNTTNIRVLDVVVDGIAHESKAGPKALTDAIERQIRSDAHLVSTGAIAGAHWHFFATEATNKVGASPSVLSLLDELGISYTIHLPVQS